MGDIKEDDGLNIFIVKIAKNVIDRVYAFHGQQGIDALLDTVKDETDLYIKSNSDKYYENVREKEIERIMERRSRQNDPKMEN